MNTTHGMDRSRARRSIESRTALGQAMKIACPTSQFVQSHPDVKAANDDLIKQIDLLAKLDAEVKALLGQIETARNQRDDQIKVVDAAMVVADATTRKHAASDADVASSGMPVQPEPTDHPVAAPELSATFDPATGNVTVTASMPPGMKVCYVFMSANPSDPASWQRVKGAGATRTVENLAPGTYWFRAQCARGEDESGFCVPVSVIVR